MAFSVLPADGTVIVDGVAYTGLTFEIDPSIHAAHERDGRITIEFKSLALFGQEEPTRPLNQIITDTAPFQFALAAWRVAHEKAMLEKAKSEESLVTMAQGGEPSSGG